MLNFATIIINYGTADLALTAAESALLNGSSRVLIVDNPTEVAHHSPSISGREYLEILRPDQNIGFAGGVNLAVRHLLASDEWTHVLLLNSDAVLFPAFTAWLKLVEERGTAAACGRVDKAHDSSGEVDSLGMTLHRCLIAANRKSVQDPLLGATGSVVLLARELIEETVRLDGQLFPGEFFCYAEDTDLALRLALRGHITECLLPDDAIAGHLGQASSGGAQSDFVAYHGLRNSLWAVIRCVPLRIIVLCLPWILVAISGICLKYWHQKRLHILTSILTATADCTGLLLRERSRIRKTRTVHPSTLRRKLTKRLYDESHIKENLSNLRRRYKRQQG